MAVEWDIGGIDENEQQTISNPADKELLAGTFYCVVGKTDEYGDVVLFEYARYEKHLVETLVMDKTRGEGFTGTLEQRLKYLNWEIVELRCSC